MIVQPTATVGTHGRLCGLTLARETNRLLAWDTEQRLYLWDLYGNTHGQHRLPTTLACVQMTDDGQRIVAAAKNGRLWWFNGALQFLFEQAIDLEPTAVALEAFGNCLAISDRERRTHLLSASGLQQAVVESPTALRWLSFVPSQTRFLGAADIGFVGCFDETGACLWQHIVVSHIGSLCIDGMGQAAWVACYSDGLRRFDPNGRERDTLRTKGSCRLACCDFDGTRLLIAEDFAGRTSHPSATPTASLSLLKPDGKVLGSYAMPQPPAFLVWDALGERGAYAPAIGPITLFALSR